MADAHAPVSRALEHRQLGKRERDLDDLGGQNRTPGGPHGVAVGFLVESVLLAEANQQDARSADTGHFVQEQGGTALAVHVTGFDDAGQETLGGRIDLQCGTRQRL